MLSCYKHCHCSRRCPPPDPPPWDYRLATFPRILAAFARLYDHIRELFNLGCFADVVENG